MKAELIRLKSAAAMVARYGAAHAAQVLAFREKMKATLMALYGVDNAMKSPILRARQVNKMLLLYGVENSMHDADLRSKQSASAFGFKIVVGPKSNLTFYTRGFEPHAVPLLENNYGPISAAGDLGKHGVRIPIYYKHHHSKTEETKNHYYWPDMVLSGKLLTADGNIVGEGDKLATICEVKSVWTLLKQYSRNDSKLITARLQGYGVILFVFDRHGNLLASAHDCHEAVTQLAAHQGVTVEELFALYNLPSSGFTNPARHRRKPQYCAPAAYHAPLPALLPPVPVGSLPMYKRRICGKRKPRAKATDASTDASTAASTAAPTAKSTAKSTAPSRAKSTAKSTAASTKTTAASTAASTAAGHENGTVHEKQEEALDLATQ